MSWFGRTPTKEIQNRPLLQWVRLFLVLTVVAAVPLVASSGTVRLVTEILIWSIFVVSLNLLVGTGGLVSLGHAAYWAIGSYTVGVLIVRWEIAPSLALLAAPVVAAGFGLLAGAVAIKRSHAYFVLLTFALGEVVYTVIFRWRGLTRGDDGLLGVARPESFKSGDSYFYFTLAITVLCVSLMYMIRGSLLGYRLAAARDSEARAASSGINVNATRLMAYGIASFFAGVAGSLWAGYQGSIFPEVGHWLRSAEGLVMIAIGGAQSFVGPILGAGIYKGVSRLVSDVTEYWLLVLGIVIFVVAFLGLDGLTGAFRRRFGARNIDSPDESTEESELKVAQ